jgi:hypothetical protein
MSKPISDIVNRLRGDLYLGEQKIARPSQTSRAGTTKGVDDSAPSDANSTLSEFQNMAVHPAPAPKSSSIIVEPVVVQPSGIQYVTAVPKETHSTQHMHANHVPTLSLNSAGLSLSLGGGVSHNGTRKTGASSYANYCFWLGIVYLGVGIACLVIAVPESSPNCGLGGSPPLRHWIYGTGIAYTIIGATYFFAWILLRNSDLRTIQTVHAQPHCKFFLDCFLALLFAYVSFSYSVALIPTTLLILLAGMFTFAWMIVGAVSLWRDGGDCNALNFRIWQMGLAAVILSIVLVVASLLGASAAPKGEVLDASPPGTIVLKHGIKQI